MTLNPLKNAKIRKILGSAVLVGTLLFGNLKLNFSQTQNATTAGVLAHEKVIQELNIFEENNFLISNSNSSDMRNSSSRPESDSETKSRQKDKLI
jgi:hypothetical protein